MAVVSRWLRNSVGLLGDVILVPVGLVLLVVLAIFSRPLFVAALAVTLLGAVFYACSSRFRHWLNAKLDDQVHYKGLRLAPGIAMHPSHSWARISPRDVVIGADDLLQAAIGPVDEVVLPAVGSRVEEGDRLFSLRRGGRNVDVRAPMAGTVLARNEMLLKRPGFVNDQPFWKGWAVRLQPEDITEGRECLVQGNAARAWFQDEIDRFMNVLHGQDGVETCLADGGALVGDLHLHIDDEAWDRLQESFFVPRA